MDWPDELARCVMRAGTLMLRAGQVLGWRRQYAEVDACLLCMVMQGVVSACLWSMGLILRGVARIFGKGGLSIKLRAKIYTPEVHAH